MAATSAILSLLRPGDHVLACDDLYGGTYRIFEKVLRPTGVTISYVDARDVAAYAPRSGRRRSWSGSRRRPIRC